MRRFFSILLFLLPIVAFAASLYWVGELFDAGEVRNGILLMLGGLGGMVLLELPMLRYWVLPRWGQALGERIYAGNYSPMEDKLVALAEEIRRTGDDTLLPRLEAMVRADSHRMRGWRELADIQLHVFRHPQEAIDTLLQGEKAVHDKEDKALLLYRAAQWTENHLVQPAQARELFELAATRYPKTVYGHKAGKKMED